MTTDIKSWGLVLLVISVLARLILPLFRRRTEQLPPGPKPLPLIGNLLQLPKTLPWLQIHHWSKQYGPIMHLDMGGQPLIILTSHQAAYGLLSKRGARYSDRPRFIMAGEMVCKGMHMLLRPYDERYKLHQRMEAPLLNLRAASSYRPLQEIESRQLLFDVVEEWDKFGEKGVDFHHHFERATASTIYFLIYGYRLKTGYEKELLEAKSVQAAVTKTAQVGRYIVEFFPSLNYLPAFLAPWKKEAEALYQLERQLHLGNLEKGLKNPGYNFSKAMQASPEAKEMSTEELAFDLGIIADAALDTSTVALSWFIVGWCSHGHLGWVKKAQRLLEEVVGRDRLPTFDDRPELAYIDAIASEVLRWRPVAPGGVPHFIKTADSYMGYQIPANSIILPNHFTILRDPSVFGSDPDDFNPDRWLSTSPSSPPSVDVCGMNLSALKDLPQSYFGYGRRVCTGRVIARNQLFIQIARLLWAFDVEAGVVDELTGERHKVDDMACKEGFVTLPKPFKAVLRPRGQWVRDVIRKSGDTHGLDLGDILPQTVGDQS